MLFPALPCATLARHIVSTTCLAETRDTLPPHTRTHTRKPKQHATHTTRRSARFRDEYDAFVKAGAAVFGISSDSPADNAAFATSQRLQYPLLSDENSVLRKVFGIKSDLLGLLPGRQTYVFDAQSTCVLSFNDQMNPEKHVSEALAALAKVKVNA